MLCVCLMLGRLLLGTSFGHLIYENPKDVPPGSPRFSPSQEHRSEYLIKALLDAHVGISLRIDAEECNRCILGLGDLDLASSRLLSSLMGSALWISTGHLWECLSAVTSIDIWYYAAFSFLPVEYVWSGYPVVFICFCWITEGFHVPIMFLGFLF